ncbi:MAG TPA: hypothetical protein VIH33_00025 [Candidatus Limnocylindria bacterium]|jgi:hypothetical protein
MTTIARAPRRGGAGSVRRHHSQRLRHTRYDAARTTRRRLALILGLLPLASGVMLGSAVAERAPAVSRISSSQAAQSGQSIVIARHDDLAPGLAEVRVPSSISATRGGGTDQLLAVSSDAATAAVAGQIGLETTPLIMARADGSQVLVELPGLIAAAFAPDESWLAAIDGRGALWHVATADGAAQQIGAGPFIGQPVVEAGGSVLALRVPSVEAPYRSELVRVTSDGAATPLTAEALVYGVQPLADGSLAAIAHRPAGTVVLRLGGDRTTLMADLGADAVNVAVERSAAVVAWEQAGSVFLQRLPGGRAQRIADGTRPRFSADGQALLVELPTGTQLVAPDGDLIATFSTQLDFAACGEQCAP